MNNQHFYGTGAQERTQGLMASVFGWMAFALGLTGFTAYFIYSNEALNRAILQSPGIMIGLAVAQIGLVLALSLAITRISYTTAFFMFAVYAVLTGATLSSIFLIYTTGSIALTFFIAALMFGAMALYGLFTRANLTTMGSFLGMALIGLIIAMLVNMFVRSEGFDLVLACIGVIVFAGLTAWDMQKLKSIASQFDMRHEYAGNIALFLALQLYLDFINLFLSLLRIMGEKRAND